MFFLATTVTMMTTTVLKTPEISPKINVNFSVNIVNEEEVKKI